MQGKVSRDLIPSVLHMKTKHTHTCKKRGNRIEKNGVQRVKFQQWAKFKQYLYE